MAFQTLNFSNKMSSRISLEIKFWITFNTGPETRNFQGASAQIQLAQKGSIFPKKSLIFISKMAILGSFRGGSEVAFVTSVFFALSSVTYWSYADLSSVLTSVAEKQLKSTVKYRPLKWTQMRSLVGLSWRVHSVFSVLQFRAAITGLVCKIQAALMGLIAITKEGFFMS